MTAQRALGAIAAFVALGVADLVFGPGLFEQTNLSFQDATEPPDLGTLEQQLLLEGRRLPVARVENLR